MAFLHQKSCECIKTELDLFTLPPTQTSIESGKWVQYKPISSLTDDAPIEFVVPGHGEEYTDLAQTLLHVVATIVKEDGTNCEAATEKTVGPVNNWLHSMFSQVDVYLNQKLVSPQNNTYAYRAYIENLLNYGKDAKGSLLNAALYLEDTNSHMDDCDELNEGLNYRRSFIKLSKYVDMVGHLHVDMCNQNKFLMNGVEMRLRLVRARDSFAIMAKDGKYRVTIREANLFVRRCKISPSVLLAHNKTLETSTAKYPVTRVEVKSLTLPSGIQNKTLDNVFLGQIPKRIIVGFVTNKAYNGDYKSNPFNFQNFNVNFFTLYVDGEQVPSKPLQPDYTVGNGRSVLEYYTLFTGTNMNLTNTGLTIDRGEFAYGYGLMAFDLTPDQSASDNNHWNLVRNGNLRIEVGFGTALTETINCIVFAEFDNVIEIDRHRNVNVDFGG